MHGHHSSHQHKDSNTLDNKVSRHELSPRDSNSDIELGRSTLLSIISDIDIQS